MCSVQFYAHEKIKKILKKVLTDTETYSILYFVLERYFNTICASGSVGGARPCQGRGRGFESRLALFCCKKIRKSRTFFVLERYFNTICASGSVGGARPCQGRGRGFESRLALFCCKKIRKSRTFLRKCSAFFY